MAKGSDPTDSIVTVVYHHHNALVLLLFQTPKPKTKPKQKWWHYTTSIWLLRDLLFLPHSRYLWPREAPEHGERTMNDWAEYPLYYSYDRVLFGFFGFSIKEEEEEERREETIIAILAFATIRDWRANGFFFFIFTGRLCDFPDVGMSRSRLRCVHPCTQKLA